MNRSLCVFASVLALGLSLWTPTPASAQSCHGHGDEGLEALELPGTSLFHLDEAFTDHRGEAFELTALRGRPTVVVMFYAGCTTACPILFGDAMGLERALDDDVREQTQFVFVTIDPERDTTQVLATQVAHYGVDDARWTLLRGSDAATRALAAVLGIQYRADGQGNFSHTNRLTVLDAEGSVVMTVDGLRQPIDEAAATLTSLVRDAAAVR